MIARDMKVGCQYQIKSKFKHQGCQVVEYSHRSNSPGNPGFACVHERGELDFQSLIGIGWTEEVEPMPDVVYEDKCPACGTPLQPTYNPDNPVCRRNNSPCDCGWMGNYMEEGAQSNTSRSDDVEEYKNWTELSDGSNHQYDGA
jgi:hypothetical protein